MEKSEKKQFIRKEMLKKRSLLAPEEVLSIENDSFSLITGLISRYAHPGDPVHKDSVTGTGSGIMPDMIPPAADPAVCDRRFTIMSYMSYRNEFPTHRLNQWIIDQGFRLVLPFTDSDFNIIPCIVENMEALRLSSMGIAEPDPKGSVHACLNDIDLMIMPGLAFDLSGNRIGFGKGCYDRLLSSAPSSIDLIALAYDFQVFDSIPAEVNDIPCSSVVTESRIINTGCSQTSGS